MIVSYLINTIKNIVGLKSKVYRGLIGLSRFEIIFFLLKKNLHKLLSGIVRSKRHCTKKEVFHLQDFYDKCTKTGSFLPISSHLLRKCKSCESSWNQNAIWSSPYNQKIYLLGTYHRLQFGSTDFERSSRFLMKKDYISVLFILSKNLFNSFQSVRRIKASQFCGLILKAFERTLLGISLYSLKLGIFNKPSY